MADAQKEGFRKYLESAGVIDALTKGEISSIYACEQRSTQFDPSQYPDCAVLVSLYEEPDKPKQAIE